LKFPLRLPLKFPLRLPPLPWRMLVVPVAVAVISAALAAVLRRPRNGSP